jgi:hypothetical protein
VLKIPNGILLNGKGHSGAISIGKVTCMADYLFTLDVSQAQMFEPVGKDMDIVKILGEILQKELLQKELLHSAAASYHSASGKAPRPSLSPP